MKRFLLIGNYGVGNLGDEALKEYFLTRYREVSWTIVSAHPQLLREVPRLPCGFRSLFTPWWRTLLAFAKSDGIVFGGGSLFTDSESSFACFLWWEHVLLARVFRKPVAFAFQGIGPLRTPVGRWFTRAAFRSGAFLSVRDAAAENLAGSFGLSMKVVLSFDPVFSLFGEQNCHEGTKKLFVVIPRANSSEKFSQRAREIADARRADAALILSLAPGHPEEKRFCASLRSSLRIPAEIRPVVTLADLQAGVCDASFVLAQRYHGALAALACRKEVEVLPQAPRDKLAELVRECADRADCLKRVQDGEEALRTWMRGV